MQTLVREAGHDGGVAAKVFGDAVARVARMARETGEARVARCHSVGRREVAGVAGGLPGVPREGPVLRRGGRGGRRGGRRGVGGRRRGDLAVWVVQGAVGPRRGELGAGLGASSAHIGCWHRLGLVRQEFRRYKPER